LAEFLNVGCISLAGIGTEAVVVMGDVEGILIDELCHGVKQADTVGSAGDGEENGAGDFAFLQMEESLQVTENRML